MLDCLQKDFFFPTLSSVPLISSHLVTSERVMGWKFLVIQPLLYFTTTLPNNTTTDIKRLFLLGSVRRFSSLKRQKSVLSFSTTEHFRINFVDSGVRTHNSKKNELLLIVGFEPTTLAWKAFPQPIPYH